LAAAAVAVALAIGPAGIARAVDGPSFTLDPTSGPPGAPIAVAGGGVPGGNLVVLYLDDLAADGELASTTAATDGDFAMSFAIPAATSTGDHLVLGCFGRSRASLQCNQMRATLRVTAPPRTTTTTTDTTAPVERTTTTTTNPGSIGVLETSTTIATPSQVGVTTTTLGGDPPFDGQLPLSASTTLALPGSFAGENGESIPNLAITHLEVTQGLQNLANEFPLVRQRPTTIRIHGTSESTGPFGQTGVMAAVEGIRDAQSLGIVYAENTPVHWDGDLHRERNDRVPYVRIPNSWTTGTLTLRAWVWAIDPTAGNEPAAADNLDEITVTFDAHGPLPELWYYPLFLTEDFDPDGAPMIHTAADGWLLQHVTAARLLPVPALVGHPQNTVFGFPWTGWNLHPDSGLEGEPLAALALLHEANGAGPLDMYVGMVDPGLDTDWIGGLASGSAPVIWTKMHGGFRPGSPWSQRGGETLAHEVGHLFDLDHAPCKYEVLNPTPVEEKGGPWDLGFPAEYGWPDCSLAPTDGEGFYGFEVLWELSDGTEPAILTNNNGDDPPHLAFPWMGYKHPGWLDPWHGCQVLDAIGVACTQTDLVPIPPGAPNGGAVPQGGNPNPHGIPAFNCHDLVTDIDLCQFLPPGTNDPIPAGADGTVALVPPAGWDESQGRMVVSGWIDPATDDADAEGSLSSVLRLPGDALPDRLRVNGDPAGGGPFVVALVDADGTAQWVTTVEVEPQHAHGDFGDSDEGVDTGAPTRQPFSISVPNLPGIDRVILASPGGTLAELSSGGSAPTLALDGAEVADDLVVHFNAGDPDGDDVLTLLQWRAGGEGQWQTVGVDLNGPEARIPLRDLVGGDGVLRLVATDGFQSSAVELGGIAVPTQPPAVSILTPFDGAVVPAGRTIDLRGQAVLPGSEALTADALVWSSSVHGILGSGETLSIDGLAEGTHQLRLTATPPTGPRASATITVEIGETDLPPAEVQALVRAALDTIPIRTAASGGAGGLPWVLVGAGALALGATGAVVGTRRSRAAN
jgi:hypothetical protein